MHKTGVSPLKTPFLSNDCPKSETSEILMNQSRWSADAGPNAANLTPQFFSESI